MSGLTKKGVLGLLSLMVAVNVFVCADDSVVRYVVGGADGTLADCKKPCKDTDDAGDDLTSTLKECLDPCEFKDAGAECKEGDKIGHMGKCNKRYCTINYYRYYKCDPGAPASGNECKWKDCAGWRRKHVIYQEDCTTTTPAGGPDWDNNADWIAACKMHGIYAGQSTPCITTACGTGEVKDTNDTYMGRHCCN